ncbi:hypothetical protein PSTG_18195 [Puccinia striiformis f. sp. tritici PST-78]|uniref:BED-type domain-containing protein n=1 Tax=Puccinia striiformis f. sp. tritici PST-78 TaxID=1165861 RepID=A0A0L0UN56_9BASI|nr:hypothetical protein PSTG_18195 [Puccinia striiformis f. sp. tritici PST-78]
MARSNKKRRRQSSPQEEVVNQRNQPNPNSDEDEDEADSPTPSATPGENDTPDDERLAHAIRLSENQISAAYASYLAPKLSKQLDKFKRRMIAWECKLCGRSINRPANDRSCSNLLTHAGRCHKKHSAASGNKTLASVGVSGTGDIDPRESYDLLGVPSAPDC